MKKLRMKRACDVPLSQMTPVSGGHHCHQCDKMVWDLRGATQAEAEALFARSESTPCVRFVPDARGFAVLRPSAAAMAVGAALFAASAMGCEDAGAGHAAHPGEPHTDQHTEDLGLAGEPMMIEDPPETPAPGTETPEGTAAPDEGSEAATPPAVEGD